MDCFTVYHLLVYVISVVNRVPWENTGQNLKFTNAFVILSTFNQFVIQALFYFLKQLFHFVVKYGRLSSFVDFILHLGFFGVNRIERLIIVDEQKVARLLIFLGVIDPMIDF